MLALPQFSGGFGAMENWGLVIYNYQGILAKLNEMSSGDVALAAEVTAHELAHQV